MFALKTRLINLIKFSYRLNVYDLIKFSLLVSLITNILLFDSNFFMIFTFVSAAIAVLRLSLLSGLVISALVLTGIAQMAITDTAWVFNFFVIVFSFIVSFWLWLKANCKNLQLDNSNFCRGPYIEFEAKPYIFFTLITAAFINILFAIIWQVGILSLMTPFFFCYTFIFIWAVCLGFSNIYSKLCFILTLSFALSYFNFYSSFIPAFFCFILSVSLALAIVWYLIGIPSRPVTSVLPKNC